MRALDHFQDQAATIWHGCCSFLTSKTRQTGGVHHVDHHRGTYRRAEAALHLAVRPGPRRAGAWRHPGDGRSGLRHRAQDPQRRLPEADLDDRGPDRVLRRRARHCRCRRPQEGRPGRRQGAGLFRGDDDGRPRGRSAARLSLRSRPRHEHRSLDARRQGAQHLCRQRAQAVRRRPRRLPDECDPQHLLRCAVAQRRAPGAVLRGPVRCWPCARRRREGRAGHIDHRRGLHRAVSGHGADRAGRAARRARRGRLYRRQIRRRLAEAARLAGDAVLRLGRHLRAGRARRRDGARRNQHPQIPRLPARRADHRAREPHPPMPCCRRS
ncbi:hypothetical protein ACVWZR_006753 [Bradyrhizobium sp. i1.3.1]